jgi:hypothetical protein
MAHLVAFGREIGKVMIVYFWNNWHLINNIQIEASKVESFCLFWIIRQQTNLS